MVVNKTLIEIENMIKMKKSFILCTYYIDTYSNFYTAMLNKELKKVFIDIFYIGVEDFLKICNLNKRIFPIINIASAHPATISKFDNSIFLSSI